MIAAGIVVAVVTVFKMVVVGGSSGSGSCVCSSAGSDNGTGDLLVPVVVVVLQFDVPVYVDCWFRCCCRFVVGAVALFSAVGWCLERLLLDRIFFRFVLADFATVVL